MNEKKKRLLVELFKYLIEDYEFNGNRLNNIFKNNEFKDINKLEDLKIIKSPDNDKFRHIDDFIYIEDKKQLTLILSENKSKLTKGGLLYYLNLTENKADMYLLESIIMRVNEICHEYHILYKCSIAKDMYEKNINDLEVNKFYISTLSVYEIVDSLFDSEDYSIIYDNITKILSKNNIKENLGKYIILIYL